MHVYYKDHIAFTTHFIQAGQNLYSQRDRVGAQLTATIWINSIVPLISFCDHSIGIASFGQTHSKSARLVQAYIY